MEICTLFTVTFGNTINISLCTCVVRYARLSVWVYVSKVLRIYVHTYVCTRIYICMYKVVITGFDNIQCFVFEGYSRVKLHLRNAQVSNRNFNVYGYVVYC